MIELNSELVFAVSAVVCAGVLRGFSGFGVGMVLVPVLSLLYEPVVAVLTVVLLEFIPSIQLLPKAVKNCEWKSVIPISIVSMLTIPLGSLLLIHIDIELMRIVIACVVLVGVLILASGWRYQGEYSVFSSMSTGAVSGLISGATGLGGLPVILYFLSGKLSAESARATIVVFLLFTFIVSVITYSVYGLFTPEILLRALWFVPPFVFAIALGGWLFGRLPEKVFRQVALIVLACVGLMALVK